MCIFCDIEPGRIVAENDLAYAIYDGYPVTELHTLIIPKRHAETYFELTKEEREACHQLLVKLKDQIQLQDSAIDGFNIGTNNGESAGQTVFHCHIHLIPRRPGDTDNPKGGVRGVIPGKQQY
jgi:ATP adenylyltransferase